MAISLVQHIGGNTGNPNTTLTLTLGASTTAGNCLVVVAATRGNVVPPSITGITLGGSAGNFAQLVSQQDGSGNSEIFIWADPNCAGGQTSVAVTMSGAGGGLCADVYEFSGVKSASPLDQSSTNSGTGVTSWTSNATPTTTQAVEAWVGGASNPGGTAMTGPSSPWTNETQQNNGSTAELSGYQITSSTGAATYSGTASSINYAAAVVTLLPAPVVPIFRPVNVRQALMRAATR